jgi:LacI family transcriptional regulator, galactose operon repressor
VAFLGDAVRSPDTLERWSGVRASLSEAGLTATEPIPAGFNEQEGGRAVADLLAGRLPDAVVCANDELALGLIAGLKGAGVRVPDDVVVTGWDDVMAARYAGLTTVRQPMRKLGMHAAWALDRRIRGDRGPARHQVLPTQLVVRNSCGFHPREMTTGAAGAGSTQQSVQQEESP